MSRTQGEKKEAAQPSSAHLWAEPGSCAECAGQDRRREEGVEQWEEAGLDQTGAAHRRPERAVQNYIEQRKGIYRLSGGCGLQISFFRRIRCVLPAVGMGWLIFLHEPPAYCRCWCFMWMSGARTE